MPPAQSVMRFFPGGIVSLPYENKFIGKSHRNSTKSATQP